MGHDQSPCKEGGIGIDAVTFSSTSPSPEAAGRVTLLSQSAPTAQLGYQDFLRAFYCLYEATFWLGSWLLCAHCLSLRASLVICVKHFLTKCLSHQKILTEPGTFNDTFFSHFMVTALFLPNDVMLANTFRLIALLPAISVICHSSHMPWLMMWYRASQCQPTSNWDTGLHRWHQMGF